MRKTPGWVDRKTEATSGNNEAAGLMKEAAEPSLTRLRCLLWQYVLHGSDLRSLHRNLPASVLPEEYGGTAGRLDMGAWSRLLLDCEEEFIVEFCQPHPLEGAMLPDSVLYEGEQAGGSVEDTFRSLRSQLYYCYWREDSPFPLKPVEGKLPIYYVDDLFY